jgi:hypothetical protein
MKNSTIKSLKLPLFDGTAAKSQIWWVRFKVFASCSGFSKALGDIIETAMPATELTAIAVDDAGALVKKAKERNQVAFAQLMMAFTTEAPMTFIYEGMTDTDRPGGLAYLVVKALQKKYMPDDTISKVELRMMMNNIKMKENADSVKLFNQISAVKVRNKRGAADIPMSTYLGADEARKQLEAESSCSCYGYTMAGHVWRQGQRRRR